MPQPFRFSLQTQPDQPQDWRDLARFCEDAGYSAIQIPDHFDPSSRWSPIVALTVAAEATTSIRVGPLVLGNDFKHPAIVAKELATLHLASDGRVEVGIGAGWMKLDYDLIGLPYDPPKVRVARLAEAIDVIEGCFAPGPFSFQGAHYAIADYDAKPDLPSRPLLMIGGGGRAVLTLAAQRADIVGVNPNLRAGTVDPATMRTSMTEQTDQKVAWVRAAAGERIDAIELQSRYFIAKVTDDKAGFAETAAPRYGITPEEVLDGAMSLVGTVDDICEQLEQRRERWGFNYIVIGNGAAEEFAPVVARLAGK